MGHKKVFKNFIYLFLIYKLISKNGQLNNKTDKITRNRNFHPDDAIKTFRRAISSTKGTWAGYRKNKYFFTSYSKLVLFLVCSSIIFLLTYILCAQNSNPSQTEKSLNGTTSFMCILSYYRRMCQWLNHEL